MKYITDRPDISRTAAKWINSNEFKEKPLKEMMALKRQIQEAVVFADLPLGLREIIKKAVPHE